jgi:hypothetical protein
LNPGVQGPPGQHSKTPSQKEIKNKKGKGKEKRKNEVESHDPRGKISRTDR